MLDLSNAAETDASVGSPGDWVRSHRRFVWVIVVGWAAFQAQERQRAAQYESLKEQRQAEQREFEKRREGKKSKLHANKLRNSAV